MTDINCLVIEAMSSKANKRLGLGAVIGGLGAFGAGAAGTIMDIRQGGTGSKYAPLHLGGALAAVSGMRMYKKETSKKISS